MALDGGADGLAFYDRICAAARDFLVPGGALVVEHGFDQADAVRARFEAAGFHACDRRQRSGQEPARHARPRAVARVPSQRSVRSVSVLVCVLACRRVSRTSRSRNPYAGRPAPAAASVSAARAPRSTGCTGSGRTHRHPSRPPSASARTPATRASPRATVEARHAALRCLHRARAECDWVATFSSLERAVDRPHAAAPRPRGRARSRGAR